MIYERFEFMKDLIILVLLDIKSQVIEVVLSKSTFKY